MPNGEITALHSTISALSYHTSRYPSNPSHQTIRNTQPRSPVCHLPAHVLIIPTDLLIPSVPNPMPNDPPNPEFPDAHVCYHPRGAHLPNHTPSNQPVNLASPTPYALPLRIRPSTIPKPFAWAYEKREQPLRLESRSPNPGHPPGFPANTRSRAIDCGAGAHANYDVKSE